MQPAPSLQMSRMNTTKVPRVPDYGIRAVSHLQTGYEVLRHGAPVWRAETRASTPSIKVALMSWAMHPVYANWAME